GWPSLRRRDQSSNVDVSKLSIVYSKGSNIPLRTAVDKPAVPIANQRVTNHQKPAGMLFPVGKIFGYHVKGRDTKAGSSDFNEETAGGVEHSACIIRVGAPPTKKVVVPLPPTLQMIARRSSSTQSTRSETNLTRTGTSRHRSGVPPAVSPIPDGTM